MLEQRIAALGLAHELLTHTGTEWPCVQDILKIELRPYLAHESEGGPRVRLIGPEVRLSSQFIPTFILVIHELVSNAVKYGALSVPGGQVTVTWYPVNGGGITLVNKLRRTTQSSIPVICVSGYRPNRYNLIPALEFAKGMGVDLALYKPIAPNQLLDAVTSLL